MRYFFNIVESSGPVIDPVGTEFESFAEARAEAIESAREIMADWLNDGQAIHSDCFIEITDDQQRLLDSIPLETIALGSALSERHRRLYNAVPHAYLLLTPTLGILEANLAYLHATSTDLASIRNQQMFDVFPDNPGSPEADGVQNLMASLQVVLSEKKSHRMAPQRYDIRTKNGRWEERHWTHLNVPVLGDDGEVDFIVHTVEDITEQVLAQSPAKE